MKVQDFLHKFRESLYGGGISSGERTLLLISNSYLYYYVLSDIAGIILILLGWDVNIISEFFSFVIIFFSFVMFFMFLSPRVPKRFLLPPVLYIPVALISSLPIFLLSGMNQTITGLVLSGGQLVVGVLVLILIKIRYGTWFLQAKSLNSKSFSRGYLLSFIGGTALIVIIFASGTFCLFTVAIKYYSSDFVRITPVSIQFAQKTLANGDKRVMLCGMSHIAGNDFYKGLKEKFHSQKAIILTEGARDRKKVLKEKSNYKGMASLLGQSVQPNKFSETIPHKNADLDVSEFSPDTIDCLNWAMSFHSLLDTKIDSPQKMFLLMKNQRAFSEKYSQDPGKILRSLEADLVAKRKTHLFQEISSALAEYETVIVPWGVWHMPGVEQMLKEKGFVCQEINYSSIF